MPEEELPLKVQRKSKRPGGRGVPRGERIRTGGFGYKGRTKRRVVNVVPKDWWGEPSGLGKKNKRSRAREFP